LNTDEQDVRDAVLRSNTAWMKSLETASDVGLENYKTEDSLTGTLARVTALRQQHQHWKIHLRDAQVPWIHVFRSDYAQALILKDEYRALWDNGASSPAQVYDTTYYGLDGLRRVNGHWLVSTATTTWAAGESDSCNAADQGNPVDVVRVFYATVAAHNYASGYALFTDALKNEVGDEAVWARQFAGEVGVQVDSARVVLRDPIMAAVKIDLKSTWLTKSSSYEKHHSVGAWLLQYKDGGWHLDDVMTE